ncbi:hypothetical protein B0T26DRAFT_677484 [Lasiosphaeria miniovina]|uniref:Uncharacterized protein n=1 Tax=Lasiosphaeria miniovina TaxID=1954250 RepID=A0AA40DTU1_9PEZI|nr:uncharacterized protein B0T26DRAFT_677484 [Lasiosphaeria miniovina]KAK0713107.1 hypothetical protein B0T26DRAFT_677484 [Lasiosphaeria miniovina]
MAERNPLVAGGTHKGLSSHPDTFLTHTLPFLSDFYALNYLLNSSVADQTWLTAAKPERLLEKHGDFLHGHPHRGRKVVLSRDLLDSDITPITLVEPAGMIDRFLDEVSKASLRAKKARSSLLLIVFCHGIEGHYLCLDNGDRRRGLSIVRLKAALEPGVFVTLFTTACFSGGWAITPELNITTLAAATPDASGFSRLISEDFRFSAQNDDLWQGYSLTSFALVIGTEDRMSPSRIDLCKITTYVAHAALLEGGAKIHPADHQGPVFYRPLKYIATAIAETCTTKEDTDEMIEKYCEFVASIRQFHLDRVVKSIPFRRKGHN